MAILQNKRALALLLALLIPANLVAFKVFRDRFASPAAPGADGTFLESEADARALAASSGRPLFLFFTGSDWCKYCKMMDQQVFATPVWREFAARRLVLLMVDNPKHRTLPAAVVQQNDALRKTHGIDSQPVMVLLTAEGRELGRFPTNLDPAVFVADVEKLL